MNKPRTYNDRERRLTDIGTEDLTEQSHAEGCDLEVIMRRYTQTGQLPIGHTRGQPRYGDAPDQEYDYCAIMRTVAHAKSQYENLPKEVKDAYTSPEHFVEALSDPAERHKMEEFGILAKKQGDSLPDTSRPSDGSNGRDSAQETAAVGAKKVQGEDVKPST